MVLQHLVFAGFLILTSLLFALVEIQIEGPHGWASALPTWRYESRFTRLLLGNRAITGYHVFFQFFVIALLHLPYALGVGPLSAAVELRILSFAALFWVIEDFLWFVCNPAFGVKAFNPERAWWHAPNWWLIMPRDYWLFLPLGILLYVLSWRL
jgi:hypothetical protein